MEDRHPMSELPDDQLIELLLLSGTSSAKEAARRLADRRRLDLQQELLVMLAEEAAEVVLATAKALRHGLDSRHPDSPQGPTNQQAMQNELGDVTAVVSLLGEAGVRVKPDPQQLTWAVKAKRRWMHNSMKRSQL